MAKTTSAPAPAPAPAPARSRARAAAAAPAKGPPVARAAAAATPSTHGVKDIRAQLEQLGGDWEDTEERSFGEVPDAKYQVKVASVTINNAKASGRLQASWDLIILNTKERGRHLFKHDGIDDADGRAWFRGSLARLGVDWPGTPAELPDILDGLVDSFAQVTVRTKKDSDFQNTYFDKALDDADLEDGDVDENGEATPVAAAPAAAPTRPAARAAAPAPAGKPRAAAPAPAPEPEPEPEAGEEAEPGAEAEGIEAEFDDAKLTGRAKREIKDLAKSLEFVETDYENLTDLLCDMGEYKGLAGAYADAMQLIAEIKAVPAA